MLKNGDTEATDFYNYLVENYKTICYNISNACAKYRSPDDKVDIMGVTKTVPADVVNASIDMGVNLLGENRVQEYLSKRELYKPAKVHIIGHLQTNKVKYIVDNVDMIQSVDSVKLATEINRLAQKCNKTMDVLLEVNIGGEESKSGVSVDRLAELADFVSQLPSIRLRGLMTIPPIGCSESVFEKMHGIYLDAKSKYGECFDTLSMGMSGDYELAIKHGSTLVRLGTALYGARKYTEEK